MPFLCFIYKFCSSRGSWWVTSQIFWAKQVSSGSMTLPTSQVSWDLIQIPRLVFLQGEEISYKASFLHVVLKVRWIICLPMQIFLWNWSICMQNNNFPLQRIKPLWKRDKDERGKSRDPAHVTLYKAYRCQSCFVRVFPAPECPSFPSVESTSSFPVNSLLFLLWGVYL